MKNEINTQAPHNDSDPAISRIEILRKQLEELEKRTEGQSLHGPSPDNHLALRTVGQLRRLIASFENREV